MGRASSRARNRARSRFPSRNVVEGNNQLTLTAQTANDYTGTGSLELAYPAAYVADGDALTFTAPAGTRVTVGGFTTSDVRVIDVTDGARPVELPVTVLAGPVGTWRASMRPAPGRRDASAVCVHGGEGRGGGRGDPRRAVVWAASHDGELLIISPAAFMDAVAPLVTRRVQEGWTVQIADVQDVYDEQGFGDKSAGAIRAFIRRARASWRVPPRFVLFVGDATFDSAQFPGQGRLRLHADATD